MSLRTVFDTNTLVSAALRIDSVPRRALVRALAESEVCASPQTLAELERVFKRRRFDRYLPLDVRMKFLSVIRSQARIFPVSEADLKAVKPACRNVNDNMFLALAAVAGAQVIISGDQDLLVLNPWRGIEIRTPAEFLVHLESEGETR